MNLKRISLRYTALFLIIPFSGFYITKLEISPVYILLTIGVFLTALLIIKIRKSRFDDLSILALILLIYLVLTQLLFNNPDIPTFLNVIFSIFIFIVVHSITYTVDTNSLIKLSKYLVYFSLPLLVIESVYRITHPETVLLEKLVNRGAENLFFYAYKFNSIMYQDSNFVAMFILALFFYWIYLNSYIRKKEYVITFALIILMIATLSRSTIFSMFLFLILYNFKSYLYKYRMFLIFILLPILPFIVNSLSSLSSLDSSFSTKFDIFTKTKHYFLDTDWNNKFFGVGFGNSVEAIGIGAHNFFITNLVEGGLVGLLLLIIFWTCLLLKSKYKIGIVMFPFLFSGLSFASLAIPYLYIIFALILELERRKYDSF